MYFFQNIVTNYIRRVSVVQHLETDDWVLLPYLE